MLACENAARDASPNQIGPTTAISPCTFLLGELFVDRDLDGGELDTQVDPEAIKLTQRLSRIFSASLSRQPPRRLRCDD